MVSIKSFISKGVLLCAVALFGLALMTTSPGNAETKVNGLGGTKESATRYLFGTPRAVRNERAQPGQEIAILRYFKIEKGAYPEFYSRSEQDIWPYWEKVGARIVGIWKVDQSALGDAKKADYDEVYLLTRYASLEHWKASRFGVDLGGNGPDAEAMIDAHAFRQSVTLETSFTVLKGALLQNGPYFMPAVKE